ncbi:MAG: response regulator [bacterium]
MPYKILIADDEENLITLVRDNLEMEDFLVISAQDGIEALEIAATEKPDLILLDVGMPKIDGIEVCRRLKSNAQTSHIPIIFLSALVRGEDVRRGLEVGAERYLPKPCTPRQLIRVVKEELHKKK